MDTEGLNEIADWIVRAGIEGRDEAAMLEGLCVRLVERGIQISRASLAIDTLHPVHEGHIIIWSGGSEGGQVVEIAHEESRHSLLAAWLRSPFHHLRQTGQSMMRRRLDGPVLMSSDFAAAAPERGDIVSVGRCALRGFDEAQELFTLLPAGGVRR